MSTDLLEGTNHIYALQHSTLLEIVNNINPPEESTMPENEKDPKGEGSWPTYGERVARLPLDMPESDQAPTLQQRYDGLLRAHTELRRQHEAAIGNHRTEVGALNRQIRALRRQVAAAEAKADQEILDLLTSTFGIGKAEVAQGDRFTTTRTLYRYFSNDYLVYEVEDHA